VQAFGSAKYGEKNRGEEKIPGQKTLSSTIKKPKGFSRARWSLSDKFNGENSLTIGGQKIVVNMRGEEKGEGTLYPRRRTNETKSFSRWKNGLKKDVFSG